MAADLRALLAIPPFGAPTACEGGDAASDAGLAPVPIPRADCAESAWSPCPNGGRGSYRGVAVGDVVDGVVQAVDQVGRDAAQAVALAEGLDTTNAACGRVHLKPGTAPTDTGAYLVLQFQLSATGPADPSPLFTYSGREAPVATPYGNAWDDAYRRRVETVSPTAANVVTGRWVTLRFTNLDAMSGYYTPPGETLRKEANNEWTETQPDGALFRYDTGGILKTVQGVGGQRTTVVQGASGISYLQSPTGARTTYAYDVAGKVRRIQDPAGRITTLTVDGSGDLTQLTTPDLQITGFQYASPA